MTKLNQVIAIEKGVKARVYGELTDLNKAIQKPELFNGFQKTYRKKDDEGEDLPSESKRVQFRSKEVLQRVERGMTELMAVVAQKDWTNCSAKADVVLDGRVLFSGAPVSFLLFMEKQLTDVRTLIGNLPVLDVAEDWKLDANSDLFKTEAQETYRTKKVQRSLVLLLPTVEHPGQAQMITDDVLVGYWQAVKHSGAIPRPQKGVLLERVERLLEAMKQAREAANMSDAVTVPEVGAAVFDYLLDGV